MPKPVPNISHFTNEVYKRDRGRNFVCSPPMKNQESQDAIWHGIANGNITTIATDHCPFKQAEKTGGLRKKTVRPATLRPYPMPLCRVLKICIRMCWPRRGQEESPFDKAVRLLRGEPGQALWSQPSEGLCACLAGCGFGVCTIRKKITITNEALCMAIRIIPFGKALS